jgi:hypothetical protein
MAFSLLSVIMRPPNVADALGSPRRRSMSARIAVVGAAAALATLKAEPNSLFATVTIPMSELAPVTG